VRLQYWPLNKPAGPCQPVEITAQLRAHTVARFTPFTFQYDRATGLPNSITPIETTLGRIMIHIFTNDSAVNERGEGATLWSG